MSQAYTRPSSFTVTERSMEAAKGKYEERDTLEKLQAFRHESNRLASWRRSRDAALDAIRRTAPWTAGGILDSMLFERCTVHPWELKQHMDDDLKAQVAAFQSHQEIFEDTRHTNNLGSVEHREALRDMLRGSGQIVDAVTDWQRQNEIDPPEDASESDGTSSADPSIGLDDQNLELPTLVVLERYREASHRELQRDNDHQGKPISSMGAQTFEWMYENLALAESDFWGSEHAVRQGKRFLTAENRVYELLNSIRRSEDTRAQYLEDLSRTRGDFDRSWEAVHGDICSHERSMSDINVRQSEMAGALSRVIRTEIESVMMLEKLQAVWGELIKTTCSIESARLKWGAGERDPETLFSESEPFQSASIAPPEGGVNLSGRGAEADPNLTIEQDAEVVEAE